MFRTHPIAARRHFLSVLALLSVLAQPGIAVIHGAVHHDHGSEHAPARALAPIQAPTAAEGTRGQPGGGGAEIDAPGSPSADHATLHATLDAKPIPPHGATSSLAVPTIVPPLLAATALSRSGPGVGRPPGLPPAFHTLLNEQPRAPPLG